MSHLDLSFADSNLLVPGSTFVVDVLVLMSLLAPGVVWVLVKRR